jgi:flavorubredoxin
LGHKHPQVYFYYLKLYKISLRGVAKGGNHTTKILIIYHTKTGNTQKIAQKIAEGAKTIPDVTIQLANAEEVDAKQAAQADAFAFGSPTYFSMMSGPLLTLLTEFYFVKDQLANKPMTTFATGGGSQTKAIENIESVLKAFNPNLIPGIAATNTVSATEEAQAKKLGETLAKTAKQ